MSLPNQTHDFLCTQRKRRISVNFSIFDVDFKRKRVNTPLQNLKLTAYYR